MTGSTEHTSVLLQRWHAGDDSALAQVLSAHRNWLVAHARGRLGPLRAKAETADLVQDVLVEFLRCAPRFTIANGRLFRGLLSRILENTRREQYRWWAAKRRAIARERPLPTDTVLELDAPVDGPLETVCHGEREAWLRLGIELLDPADQQVVVMRHFDGLSFPEIGEHVGRSGDAVRMQHNRALDRLTVIVGQLRRGGLSDLLGDPPG